MSAKFHTIVTSTGGKGQVASTLLSGIGPPVLMGGNNPWI